MLKTAGLLGALPGTPVRTALFVSFPFTLLLPLTISEVSEPCDVLESPEEPGIFVLEVDKPGDFNPCLPDAFAMSFLTFSLLLVRLPALGLRDCPEVEVESSEGDFGGLGIPPARIYWTILLPHHPLEISDE